MRVLYVNMDKLVEKKLLERLLPRAARGLVVLHRDALDSLLPVDAEEQPELDSSDQILTPREIAVLRMIADGLGNKEIASESLLTLGQVYTVLGDPRRSLEAYKTALPMTRDAGNQKLEAIALVSLGYAYDELGDPQNALQGPTDPSEWPRWSCQIPQDR